MSTQGLLTTVRGKGGGIRLARPAAEITVASVVRIMEDGDLKIIECLVPLCPLATMCRLKGVLDEARNSFLETLEKHTIADLIKNERALQSAGWA